MKTLDQFAPRNPIGPSITSITIGAPGSYYLAGGIAVSGTGISITPGDVTLAERHGGDGIQAGGDKCHLTNNTCASNTTAGIHDATRVTSPGAAFASTSPWANFSF